MASAVTANLDVHGASAKLAVDGAGEEEPRERSRSPHRENAAAKDADAAAQTSSTSPTASDLVVEAVSCLGELPPQVEKAQQFFEEALEMEPQSVEVLDAFGAFLCEEGDKDRAAQLLERSVALQPDKGAEKYLYLGQLSTGEQALAHYERGSVLLSAALRKAQEAEQAAVEEAKGSLSKATNALGKQLARTRASVAELYMTDLCDLPDAEDRCEEALAKGAEVDADCLELQATTAALRKVQGRIDEAKELALKCAKRIEANYREQHLLTLGDDAADDSAVADTLSDEDLVQLCRTLIDLMLTAEARSLLEVLLEKDEEDIQVWILLSYSHVVEKDGEGAKECVMHAMKLCKKLGREADCWKPMLRDLLQRSKKLVASAVASADKEPAAE